MKYEAQLKDAIEVARKAMIIVLKYYHETFHIEIKSDNSPVTDADESSNKLIFEELSKKYPDYGFLTEEMADSPTRLTKDYVWIIDPLDGTKDFITHDDQFCINIALAYKGTPIVGVVAIPVTGEIFYAVLNEGSYYLANNTTEGVKIHVNSKTDGLIQLTSVHHETEEEVKIFNSNKGRIERLDRVGSAIKACLIAKGEAEVSFRYGSGTKEWDTCAPQIVLTEAGGIFVTAKFAPITYNREDVYNRDGFFMLNSMENANLIK